MSLERGRAGTGAVLSTYAIGKQDTFLVSDKTDNSLFQYKPIQHTNFSKIFRSHIKEQKNNGESWPFGQEIRFPINPQTSSDLLANAFLKCSLPELTDGSAYCGNIGHAMIDEIKFNINGVTIDRITGDWSIMHDELFFNTSDERTSSVIIGDENPTSGPISLFIPLHLFFCRFRSDLFDRNYLTSDNFYRPYFYLCSCWNNDIEIVVKFKPVPFFSNASVQSDVYIEKLNMVTEEYLLTDEERNYYQTNKVETLIDIVEKNPTFNVNQNESNFKHNLVTSLPIKSFHWFLRNKDFEDDTNSENFLKRFNFSSNVNLTDPNLEQYSVIMSDAKIYINGSNQIGFQGSTLSESDTIGSSYYKYLQSFQHHFHAPDRNIYTYSFAIDPRNPEPTGAVNFSTLDSSKTLLNGAILSGAQSNTYSVNLYYLGYKLLKFENGFCQEMFA